MKFTWRKRIDQPGFQAFQLVGVAIPDVCAVMIQRLTICGITQWQFLIGVQVG